jgi:hypothetical protein
MKRGWLAPVCLSVCLCVLPGMTRADSIFEAVQRRAWQPVPGKPVPPMQPVAVDWRKRKLATLELGAPLLAMNALDLNGDGRAELLLLTAEALFAVDIQRPAASVVLARVTLPGKVPIGRPRDVIGTMTTDAGIRVRSSMRDRGGRWHFESGKFIEVAPVAGYPLCGDATVEAVKGRNFFDAGSVQWGLEISRELPKQFYSASCALEGAAAVNLDRLLSIRGAGTSIEYSGVGSVFLLADINQDGVSEVVTTAATPPGESDLVSVFSRAGEKNERIVYEPFQGGVAALCAGDIDGDQQLEVVAAVRGTSPGHIDLWGLNQ